MNSLDESGIIRKLYEASEVGVEIDLIVRGVCRLIHGKKHLSENIRVHSIIGKFMEHSRCYYFHHAGEEHSYIDYTDWMNRKLTERVEQLDPIYDANLMCY